MAEPFKNLLNPALVVKLGHHIARSAKKQKLHVDASSFVAYATTGLDTLEMKARAEHVADALERVLPSDFPAACEILEGTLAAARTSDRVDPARADEQGVAGWIVWPLTLFVARRGMNAPKRALASLREMTMRFTSEWAIRPFVEAHPSVTFPTLATWTRDPNVHVRRLVSEGTRPRLPWGKRLGALVSDPSPTLPLLEALRDDPSEYVRRSVANHLNDIAKDHPGRFADILESWIVTANQERTRLLSHASRTLVKAGDPRVLRAFGLDRALDGEASFRLQPSKLVLGESLALSVDVHSTSKKNQKLVVDYVVFHVRANGTSTPKVFKGWTLALGPGERRALARSHPIRPITTRAYYSGLHAVECRINGRAVGRVEFDLAVPRMVEGARCAGSSPRETSRSET